MSFEAQPDRWLAAVLGNTHVRWGWFVGETLVKVEQFPAHRPLSWPEETELWLAAVGSAPLPPGSPWVHCLGLSQVPLRDPYPGLGLDRALAVWAAGIHYGWPCLVIDAGTALTLTGADPEGSLLGGAILPGLGLQAQALADHTARLPKVEWEAADPLPPLGQGHWGCHPQWHSPHPAGRLAGLHRRLAAPLSPGAPASNRRRWRAAPRPPAPPGQGTALGSPPGVAGDRRLPSVAPRCSAVPWCRIENSRLGAFYPQP